LALSTGALVALLAPAGAAPLIDWGLDPAAAERAAQDAGLLDVSASRWRPEAPLTSGGVRLVRCPKDQKLAAGVPHLLALLERLAETERWWAIADQVEDTWDALPCLESLLAPEDAAALHRFEGLAREGLDEPDAAAGARYAVSLRLLMPDGARAWLDGQELIGAPPGQLAGGPHLLQIAPPGATRPAPELAATIRIEGEGALILPALLADRPGGALDPDARQAVAGLLARDFGDQERVWFYDGADLWEVGLDDGAWTRPEPPLGDLALAAWAAATPWSRSQGVDTPFAWGVEGRWLAPGVGWRWGVAADLSASAGEALRLDMWHIGRA